MMRDANHPSRGRIMVAVALLSLSIGANGCLWRETEPVGDANQAEFNNAPPVNQLKGGAAGVVPETQARAAALRTAQSHGESAPVFDVFQLMTYGDARRLLRLGSVNLSLADDRIVYAVIMSGDFEFRRGVRPKGSPKRTFDRIYAVIDGPTGEVMSVGTPRT